LKPSGGFLCSQFPDHQQGYNHEQDAERQADQPVLDEAGEQVAHKAHTGNGEGIGQLGGNVENMVTLGTGGGHDGGVGNGGAVVAADSAGHAGGDRNNHEFIVQVRTEYTDHDGDQNAEGTPGCAGGKAESAADQEDDGGQEVHESSGRVFHDPGNEFLCTEGVGHGLQSPGKGENQNGGNHALETFRNGVHALAEAENPGCQEKDDGQDQRDDRTEHQTHGSVRVGEGVNKRFTLEETTGVDHADDTGDDEYDDGQNQMNDFAFAADGRFRLIFRLGHGGMIPGVVRPVEPVAQLGQFHGAVVELAEGEGQHHYDGEQCIEVVGDGLDEQLQTVCAVHETGYGGGPGGDGSDDADRSGSGVDQVGQLCPGNIMFVRQRTHHGADGEAVEVVVNENKDTQNDGAELCANLGFNMGDGPASEGCRAAGPVHQHDHGTQNDQEDQNTDVPAVGQLADHTVYEHMLHNAGEAESGIENSTAKDTDEE